MPSFVSKVNSTAFVARVQALKPNEQSPLIKLLSEALTLYQSLESTRNPKEIIHHYNASPERLIQQIIGYRGYHLFTSSNKKADLLCYRTLLLIQALVHKSSQQIDKIAEGDLNRMWEKVQHSPTAVMQQVLELLRVEYHGLPNDTLKTLLATIVDIQKHSLPIDGRYLNWPSELLDFAALNQIGIPQAYHQESRTNVMVAFAGTSGNFDIEDNDDNCFFHKAINCLARQSGMVVIKENGVSITGNNLRQQIDHAFEMLSKLIPSQLAQNGVLNITGMSRGAVAGSVLAHQIMAQYPEMRINFLDLDMVKGSWQHGQHDLYDQVNTYPANICYLKRLHATSGLPNGILPQRITDPTLPALSSYKTHIETSLIQGSHIMPICDNDAFMSVWGFFENTLPKQQFTALNKNEFYVLESDRHTASTRKRRLVVERNQIVRPPEPQSIDPAQHFINNAQLIN